MLNRVKGDERERAKESEKDGRRFDFDQGKCVDVIGKKCSSEERN
jgi:hypothetical protein